MTTQIANRAIRLKMRIKAVNKGVKFF